MKFFDDYETLLQKQKRNMLQTKSHIDKAVKPKFTEQQANTIREIIDEETPLTYKQLCERLGVKPSTGKSKQLFIKNLQFFYDIDISKEQGKHKTYDIYGEKEDPYVEDTEDEAFKYFSNIIMKRIGTKPLYITYTEIAKSLDLVKAIPHNSTKPWYNLFTEITNNIIDRYLNKMVKANLINIKHGYVVKANGQWKNIDPNTDEAEPIHKLCAMAKYQAFNHDELMTPMFQMGKMGIYYSYLAKMAKSQGYQAVYACLVLEPINHVHYEADTLIAVETLRNRLTHNYLYGAQEKRYPSIYHLCTAKRNIEPCAMVNKIKFKAKPIHRNQQKNT